MFIVIINDTYWKDSTPLIFPLSSSCGHLLTGEMVELVALHGVRPGCSREDCPNSHRFHLRGESCLCAVPQMPWLPLGQGTCSVPMSPCPSALPQSEKTKAVSMTEVSSQCLLLVSISGLFSRLTQCKAEDNLEICLGSGLWSSSVRFFSKMLTETAEDCFSVSSWLHIMKPKKAGRWC